MAYPDEGVVKGWRVDWLKSGSSVAEDRYIAERAVDWEREGCCEWLTRCAGWEPEDVQEFLDHRRREPGTLKEQALNALGPEPLPETGPTGDIILNTGAIQRHRLIRRALELLNG